MSSSPSSKSAASIPNITSLREQLDYGDGRLARCNAFYDDVRAFRKKFRAHDGTPGVAFFDWRLKEHQAGLTEMTVAYLDRDGNGALFWPEDDTSLYHNKYSYTTHGVRIRRLMKQLFFRLNQQQYRNQKYKHKDKPEIGPSDDKGRSTETAIEIDSNETSSPNGRQWPRSSSNRKRTEDETSQEDYDPFQDDVASNQLSRDHTREPTSNSDLYDGPHSQPQSPRMRSFESINRASTGKRDLAADDGPNRPHKTKRHKSNTTAAAYNEAYVFKWTSPRVKKPVRRENFANLEQINAAIDRSSTDVADNIDPRLGGPNDPHPAPPLTRSIPSPGRSKSAATTSATFTTATFASRETSGSATHPKYAAKAPAPDTDGEQSQFVKIHTPTATVEPHSATSTLREPSRDRVTPSESAASRPAPAVQETSDRSKPMVNFIYRVVLTRTPKTVTERWNPRGRLQDKTMAELIRELPFEADVQGLMFTIEGPGMKTIERIPRDDEDGFESMKRYINTEIRDWFSRSRGHGSSTGTAPRLVLDLLIERMTEEDQKGQENLEDLELDW